MSDTLFAPVCQPFSWFIFLTSLSAFTDGCISVEMECAAIQAMCDFRNLNVYYFLTCGDLLDAPKWDVRIRKHQMKNTQHDSGHFEIALELAKYVVDTGDIIR